MNQWWRGHLCYQWPTWLSSLLYLGRSVTVLVLLCFWAVECEVLWPEVNNETDVVNSWCAEALVIAKISILRMAPTEKDRCVCQNRIVMTIVITFVLQMKCLNVACYTLSLPLVKGRIHQCSKCLWVEGKCGLLKSSRELITGGFPTTSSSSSECVHKYIDLGAGIDSSLWYYPQAKHVDLCR